MGRSILFLCTALACGEAPVSISPGTTALPSTGRGSAGAGDAGTDGAGGALELDRAGADAAEGRVTLPVAPSDAVRQGVVFDHIANPTRHGP